MVSRRTKILAASLVALAAGAAFYIWANRGAGVERLVSKLGSRNAAEREEAARKLGAVRDEAGIKRLVRHLGDENEETKKRVEAILLGIGKPAVGPAIAVLSEVLNRRESALEIVLEWIRADRWLPGKTRRPAGHWSRLMAVSGLLAKMGPVSADELIAVYRNGKSPMSGVAFGILADMQDPALLDIFLKDVRQGCAYTAARGLRELQKAYLSATRWQETSDEEKRRWDDYAKRSLEAAEVFLAMLADTGSERESILDTLGYFADHEKVVEAVSGIIDEEMEDPKVRRKAMASLEFSRCPAACDILLRYFRNASKDLAHAARTALLTVPQERRLAVIAGFLGDESEAVRENATAFFRDSRDPAKARVLREAYEAGNDIGRENIVRVLQDIRDHRLSGQSDPDWWQAIGEQIQRDAKEALERIGGKEGGMSSEGAPGGR